VSLFPSFAQAERPGEAFADLTGAVTAIVTLTARDNFQNEFLYQVSIKNETPDPLPLDSLVIVLDHVTDLSGKDASTRMEVVGQDGEMSDGRPYFRIPTPRGSELAPYRQSDPASVRLRNPAYTVVFTPSFRVYGHKPPSASESLNALVQLLIKKGLVNDTEWLKGKQTLGDAGEERAGRE
jgi:hypothetical protein